MAKHVKNPGANKGVGFATGGARKGAGRPTKAQELGLPALIDEVIGVDGKRDLIKQIANQAKRGCLPSQKMLMEYIYGKPTEHKKVDSETTIVLKFSDEVKTLLQN